MHRQAAMRQRRDASATRLPQQQGRLRVGIDKDDLDCRHIGLVVGVQLANAVEQGFQARGQGRGGIGFDGAAGDIALGAALHFDDAKARGAQAWVYAQNALAGGAVVLCHRRIMEQAGRAERGAYNASCF